ncbi:hypothetical protein P4O66_008620 [Electrophorus voltai]|uniref:LIM zinc-binding domain-containing protein n=1 Tax=Electrophorus voltai TaxID=2609070 RepID=A0AAD8ZF11_9TELE|nr:hypothetical protein P4O66_008620 [Electrophorus voltai]
MERIGTKLKQKFKLPDSGSVKFSKKKNELTNTNNNSNSNSASSGTVVAQLNPITNSSASPAQYTLTCPPSVEACGSQSGRPGKVVNSQRVSSCITSTPSPEESGPSTEDHPSSLAPLRRRAPQQRASCYLPESVEGCGTCDQVRRSEVPQGEQGDMQGTAYSSNTRAALNQRRYSLELQQLVRRQQLLSQAPLSSMPPPYPSHSAITRSGATEPSFLPELERHKRLSLQEALFYKRWSSGGELWDSGRPASLSHPPQRSHDGAGMGYLFPPGPTLSPCSSFSLQESVLASPRSSFASSTASGGGGAGGSPVGSPCSSNRTSGISLGYDTRHMPGPAQQLQFSSTTLGGATSGQVYVATAPGKAVAPPMEVWRDYLERASGIEGGFQDSRHSYPPAVSTPTATGQRPEPEWWGGAEQRSAPRAEGLGERVRHSDLPGTRYQQELTRLLLRDLALEGEELLGGLTLKEQPLSTCVPAPAPAVGKPQEEQIAAREPPSALDRQEFFGTCVKCGKGVYGADNACQALDSLYHTRCFTCVSCGRTLRNKDFYNVSGSVYCKEDYMFSGFQAAAEKCSVCGHLILEQGSEEILRVVSMNKDYHFECYHCEECGKQLSDKPGSQCFPLDSHLLCHSCHMNRDWVLPYASQRINGEERRGLQTGTEEQRDTRQRDRV